MTDRDPKSQMAAEEAADLNSPSTETNKGSQPPLDETLPPSWIRDREEVELGLDQDQVPVAGHASLVAGVPVEKDVSEDGPQVAPLEEFYAGAPQADIDFPMQFGEYELLEEVARGGMGVVFRARQVNLDRQVALKMILTGKLADESDVQRFYSEASSAAALEHPGVVPVYEVGEQNGQHFFSMGFVEGESLASLIGRNPLSPQKSAQMLLKISEAIVYAHGEGVIHRDLKPANVLLDKKNNPHISDFGLAKKVTSGSNLTVTGQILGTPSYMSPEQASGATDQVNEISDVYSLGALLYCCLTGRAPFQAANPMETLRQVVERDPVAPRQLNFQVDLDLDTICLKCLEKDPLRRYQSAQELVDELNRFMAGQPIQARRISTLDRAFRWCRRNPVTTGLLSALLLAIVGGVSGIAWQWGQAEYQKNLTRQAEESEMNMDSDAAEAVSDVVRVQELVETQLKLEHQDFLDAHGLIIRGTQAVLVEAAEQGGVLAAGQQRLVEENLQYFQQFIERHVGDQEKRGVIATAYSFSGQIQVAMNDPESALQSYQEVLQLLQKAGDSMGVSTRRKLTGKTCFESAVLHGLLDARIQASGEYTVAEKEQAHQSHQQQVAYFLNQAFASDYFSSREHRERLQQDEHLVAFRQRAEYSRLLEQLQQAERKRPR
ncbi:MAG: serine/threonine protein kinase [Planctomycetaceae bacterium]|nr:serine/threonine protein kinase [Planctomycetaceae bacterium]